MDGWMDQPWLSYLTESYEAIEMNILYLFESTWMKDYT